MKQEGLTFPASRAISASARRDLEEHRAGARAVARTRLSASEAFQEIETWHAQYHTQ